MKNNLKYLPILIFATLALGFVLGGMLNFPNVADFQIEIIREQAQ
jgi:carboxyl-terminal processing protease